MVEGPTAPHLSEARQLCWRDTTGVVIAPADDGLGCFQSARYAVGIRLGHGIAHHRRTAADHICWAAFNTRVGDSVRRRLNGWIAGASRSPPTDILRRARDVSAVGRTIRAPAVRRPRVGDWSDDHVDRRPMNATNCQCRELSTGLRAANDRRTAGATRRRHEEPPTTLNPVDEGSTRRMRHQASTSPGVSEPPPPVRRSTAPASPGRSTSLTGVPATSASAAPVSTCWISPPPPNASVIAGSLAPINKRPRRRHSFDCGSGLMTRAELRRQCVPPPDGGRSAGEAAGGLIPTCVSAPYHGGTAPAR